MVRKRRHKKIEFTLRRRHIRVILNKVLIFRAVRKLHGRFWGAAAITGLVIGFSICFAIRPDLLEISTAFSDFGNDVRTAPYFAGAVFFAAYGLWRWRNYLSRTFKRPKPIYGLITMTIIGLYLVALMPISWEPWPYRLHIFGVVLAGSSMLATVVIDGLLNTSDKRQRTLKWQSLRLASLVLIITGGWLTLGSISKVGWYDVALLGESMLLAGYALWVYVKTYLGEGNRSTLSKILKRVVIID